MVQRRTRRQVLAAGVTATAVGLSGCGYSAIDTSTNDTTVSDTSPSPPEPLGRADSSPPVDVRGAMYLPARAFNTYQMWRDTDPRVFERDMGYAARLRLNAVRTWASYEHWQEDPAAHGAALEALLSAAESHGVRVLLGLFEGVGSPPTEQNLENDDPLTATAVYSPAMAVVRDDAKWGEPREFVRWAMDRFRDEDRLLALEVMNEPGWTIQESFAEGMFETMLEERGTVPLTVGSTSLANNTNYLEWGSEIIQFHYNFPSRPDILRTMLEQATDIATHTDMPIWLTEWQRVRSGRGFLSRVEGDEWQPNYSSLAPLFTEYGVGNFFWSLMLKPAYVRAQRKQGVLSGVFHEDGAVWSLDDARTLSGMSGNPTFEGEVRQEWPTWAEPVADAYLNESNAVERPLRNE